MSGFVAFFQQHWGLFCATGVLGWSSWTRVAAVLPLLVLLWLAVWWANLEIGPL